MLSWKRVNGEPAFEVEEGQYRGRVERIFEDTPHNRKFGVWVKQKDEEIQLLSGYSSSTTHAVNVVEYAIEEEI